MKAHNFISTSFVLKYPPQTPATLSLVSGEHNDGKVSFNLAFIVVRCQRIFSLPFCVFASPPHPTFFAPLNSVGY